MEDYNFYLVLLLSGVIIGGAIALSLGAGTYPQLPANYSATTHHRSGSLLVGLVLVLLVLVSIGILREKFTFPPRDLNQSTTTISPMVKAGMPATIFTSRTKAAPTVWYLQLGTYRSLRAAKREQQMMTVEGYTTTIRTHPYRTTPYHLVLGPFSTRATAHYFRDRYFPQALALTTERMKM